MTGEENLKEGKTGKRVISNLVRGGLLVIPYAGSFLEKIIFGPLDDKARDEDRHQLMHCLSELREDVRFIQAEIKDQLAILSNKMRALNSELADKIKVLNPVDVQQLLIPEIKSIVINVFNKMSPEVLSNVIRMVGILPPYALLGETNDRIGVCLFDATEKESSLPSFIAKIVENYPAFTEELTENVEPSYVQELKSRLIDASRPLLKWPTTLGNGFWLHREELDDLEVRLRSEKQSANLLLGKPGTGKSALLATLSKLLIENGVAILAIKADMLPRRISNFDDLQKHLHLPSSVVKCLEIISRSEPIVVIIDQLDAISEIVDRSSERLNLLLDLIQIASGMRGVHVVGSCRWFEYQHDIRLTTIQAERISLEPPSWEDIKTVLKDAGFPQEHWSDEARRLLSIPLHLKILLELKSHDPEAGVPASLQGLLESIWQQRVVFAESSSNKLSFLDLLCKKMSEEEELWMPRAIADEYAHVFNELQQMNILQTDPSGLKIGFSHQTYFDFAKSRAFTRGQERLSEYVMQRQDGLFVRPILLSTLDYLRGASLVTYEREVRSLWGNQGLMPHLRNLLIDYYGSMEKPNDTEMSCLLPILKDREQGYKVLLAMAGSPGWFYIIKDIYLPSLMGQGPEFAHFIIPFLSRALSFARDEVGKIVRETWLLDAIVALSETEPDVFLTFFHENVESPYMAVHRLLCAGLLKLAASHPGVILEYLTFDPRRLVVGDSFDCHKLSRRLITAVVPHLDDEGCFKLENTVVNWSRYYREDPSWSPEDHYRRKKWNREHRLRLLRSFPEEFLSIEGIMDQVASEPEIIGRICNRVLEAGKTEIRNIGSRLALTAEPIVSIALTLHRKPQPFRAIGLELFEKLIDSNIPQARQALDILDRKPVTAYTPRPIRRRRRREQKS